MGDHFGKISACYCTLLPFNLLEVPKYFGLVHIFCHAKHLLKYSASHKHLMPDKRRICSQENWFLCWQKSFWRGTKCSQILWLAQKFGPAQNVLGPVKGQGINQKKGNLKMRLFIKSGYYSVPNPSTTLVWTLCTAIC